MKRWRWANPVSFAVAAVSAAPPQVINGLWNVTNELAGADERGAPVE